MDATPASQALHQQLTATGISSWSFQQSAVGSKLFAALSSHVLFCPNPVVLFGGRGSSGTCKVLQCRQDQLCSRREAELSGIAVGDPKGAKLVSWPNYVMVTKTKKKR